MVDKLDWDSLQYKKVDIVYFREKDGLVSFYCWGGNGNEWGYTGRHFHIKMEDGTPVTLQGPWLGRPGVMNLIPEFKQCMGVALTDDALAFERGSVYPHHATVEWVEEELKELLPDVMIVKVERSSVVPESRLQRMVGADVEIDYEPVRV